MYVCMCKFSPFSHIWFFAISFFSIGVSSLPTAINWGDGKVKFNHDHLKTEIGDKPVGKARAWGTWPGACKVWGLPLDSRWYVDVILADGFWLLAHRLALDLWHEREASGPTVLCSYHESMGSLLAFAFGVIQIWGHNTRTRHSSWPLIKEASCLKSFDLWFTVYCMVFMTFSNRFLDILGRGEYTLPHSLR